MTPDLEEILQICDHLNTVSLESIETNALGTATATRSTTIEQAIAELESAGDIIRALMAHPEANGAVVCGKVATSTATGLAFEWHDVDGEDLDYTHMVAGTLMLTDPPDWNKVNLEPGDLVVNATLHKVLTMFCLWHTNELRELAHAHELTLRGFSESPEAETYSSGRPREGFVRTTHT
ncbi:hypothetical protein GSI_14979 [Ganoderma sinense ZZ0214-1]|uniref:Uncharacterized protein n=1 Tax=Ganoderma sinense ZZ0214-1 TaxID=1077348 RepID=A0A2G8RL98_9APHY|nr:hypothetical protein GSI_14979 [Ganoderma sinense ZZ0214-1]